MKIKVVMLEPGKEAYVTEIENTLRNMQHIVGGLIEACYPFDEQVCIVCNEEGKITGLPLNRAVCLENGEFADIIAGTAFICDCSGEEFGCLNEKQCSRYLQKFASPEVFLRVDGRIVVLRG
ncbi:MAG: DUF3846 domain-containing protein [Oscillospiraceae bacterium]|nr:DUF3846 domain-containing protein [Anaerotignum sp.]MBR6790688.1 DUF3846 domain-containing protein [Oscillospiraceae bacterium]